MGLCENCDYFFQRLCVCCFHQAFPVDFDLCLRQERCLITYPKHGLNMQRVSICTMMVLESPTACFICKKCWDTNPTYPKRTHIFFSTKHFPGQHGLIFLMQTVNIILGAQPISFKKRRKLSLLGWIQHLSSPVSCLHWSQIPRKSTPTDWAQRATIHPAFFPDASNSQFWVRGVVITFNSP